MAIVQGNNRMVGCLLGVVDIGDGVGVVRKRVLLLTGRSLAFFGHHAALQMPSSLAQVSVCCPSVVRLLSVLSVVVFVCYSRCSTRQRDRHVTLLPLSFQSLLL